MLGQETLTASVGGYVPDYGVKLPTPVADLVITETRHLRKDELALLDTREDLPTSETPSLKKLKFAHHRLAQLLSAGKSEAECHIITGYSASRISILKNDPSFKELLAHYASVQDQIFVDVTQRFADVCLNGLEVLQERIEVEGESILTKDLLDIIKVTADRGGASPVAKTETKNLTIHMTSAEAAAMKAKVQENQFGKVNTVSKRSEDITGTQVGEVITAESSVVQETIISEA